MRYLVTGGCGFVGSHIIERLIEDNHEVIVFDNLKIGKINNLKKVKNKFEFINGDIRHIESMEKIIRDVDGIFHEAALASVPESFKIPNEYYEVNVIGTQNVFQLAKKNRIKVIFASSSSVYGNPTKIPISENDSKNPINPYANTKAQCEKIAEEFSQKGVEIIGLRYFNIFGERQSTEYAGVIKKFLKRISQKLPPMINGDGNQIRDFVYVKDVVSANITAMNSEIKNGFFNVGTGKSISIIELAEYIISEFGFNFKPIFGPELIGDILDSKANISHAKEILHWNPTTDIKNRLKDVKNHSELLGSIVE